MILIVFYRLAAIAFGVALMICLLTSGSTLLAVLLTGGMLLEWICADVYSNHRREKRLKRPDSKILY